jgi:mono/diheme cytochrome c family protein
VPDAGPPFAALADDPATSESAMRGFLHDPQPPMPPLELSGRQIDHILAYIASLKTPEPPGDVAAGRGFAETHCARCHAVGIEGDSPFREAPPFREFLAKWQPEYLAEAFAEGIVVGHPAMPAFELNTEEIDDLLAYLETLKAS